MARLLFKFDFHHRRIIPSAMQPSTLRTSLVFRRTFASGRPRVAVLYQALNPPVINGVRKPKKPGGTYRSLAFSGSL